LKLSLSEGQPFREGYGISYIPLQGRCRLRISIWVFENVHHVDMRWFNCILARKGIF
jgi:hypothetical protein